jgi:hypothetical protein
MSEGAPARRRWIAAAAYAAIAAFLAWAAWGVWHDRQLPKRFERIGLGQDRAAVEALLGRPDRDAGCERDPLVLPREGCRRVLVYSSAFAPLVPTYYVVQLDARGRVIEADDVHSP